MLLCSGGSVLPGCRENAKEKPSSDQTPLHSIEITATLDSAVSQVATYGQ